MNKLSVAATIQQQYIDQYLESSKKLDYTELVNNPNLVTVLYKDLPHTNIQGYPVASDYVSPDGNSYTVEQFASLTPEQKSSCQLRYYYLPKSHELYIGTTGSGKTTGCVEPQLRAISAQHNKPNLFFTDPKGELFDRNAQYLKDNGYQIFVLNFKDTMRSDKWNPLLEVYQEHIKLKNIGKNCIARTGAVPATLTLAGQPDEFDNRAYLEYDNKAFPNGRVYDTYLQFQHDYIESKVDNLLNQLVHMMIATQSEKDKSWELGAQELLKGIIICMLEDAVDDSSGFTSDMMTFKTLQQYYLALKLPILADEHTLYTHPLLKNKSSKVKALMSTALANANNTMRSYCGVFDGAVRDWFQGHIFALTTGNTVTLNNSDKPFAIFLITRDYEKSDFLIAGLFVTWVYRQMIIHAETNHNHRTMHFMLDEFGNIPKIEDIENKISTARSRDIWFHLVVQSYKQIDIVYGQEPSIVIRDNCNAQIFLGAQNTETKEIFSRECGKHNIPTLDSKIHPQNNTLQEVPLIPVSTLDLIKPGQMYTKRLNMPVMTTQFIRSYICAEQGAFANFTNANGLITCTPTYFDAYSSDRYTFAKLTKPTLSPAKLNMSDILN